METQSLFFFAFFKLSLADTFVKPYQERKNMEKEKWEVIEECSDEDGTPASWALKIREREFIFISANNDMYDVEIMNLYKESVALKSFKSLRGAKRFAEEWVRKYNKN